MNLLTWVLYFLHLFLQIQNHFVWCENVTSRMLVMGGGGGVLSNNLLASTSPGANKFELFLIDTPIAQPMEKHVHGFCAFWLDT